MRAAAFVQALALLLVLAAPARALEPGEALSDPGLEARARAISSELRCLVCQNQSIDDSHADLARDLRLLVRERLTAGDSDQQVRDFLVARYGDFILLKPPVNWGTLLLWGGPFLFLLAGAGALVVFARRRGPVSVETEALSEAEQAELARLTAEGPADAR